MKKKDKNFADYETLLKSIEKIEKEIAKHFKEG